MLKVTDEEGRDEALQDVEFPQRVPARDKGSREETNNRSRSRKDVPDIEKQKPEAPEGQHPNDTKSDGKARKSFLRRRPIASSAWRNRRRSHNGLWIRLLRLRRAF